MDFESTASQGESRTLKDHAKRNGDELWGDDWTQSSRPADVDSLPSMKDVSEKFRRVCDLAREHLHGPISTRIRTWEDGEFEIRVFHGFGPFGESDVRLRAVLRYHSPTGDVTAAILEVDGDERRVRHREQLTNLGAVDVE